MVEEEKLRENERVVLRELQESELFQKTGQACYIISKNWFQQWENFVTQSDSERPSEIDNSSLIQTFEKNVRLDSEKLLILKDNLHEEVDFKVLDSKSWSLLLKWYKGGPEIKRYVIEEGELKIKRVEIYLLRINILRSNENGGTEEVNSIAFYRSKQITLLQLQKQLCEVLELDERKVRLWNAFDINNFEPFAHSQLSETLNDLQLQTDQKILVEVQLENGVWPISKERAGFYAKYIQPIFTYTRSLLFSTTESVSSVASTFTIPTLYGSGKAQEKGLCGLNNLGNTCFMNSALQCLSHTQPLTQYFLSDLYILHINKDNPLGTRGNLAEQYALLIKALWSGDYGQVAPKNLKWAIGKFAPRFSGYAQQDAQELLAYLLDGLHEDLNQIKQKPYVPIEDSNNRPDEEVSKEHWEKHLMRNKSIIVDQFQAQLKSTLVCPTCGKVSITFDPFMYLSLPLPTTLEVFKFTLFSFDKNTAPITYAVQMPKRSRVSEFKDLITQITKIKRDDLVLVEVSNGKISAMARDSSYITSRVDEYHCYEINPDVKNDQFCFVPISYRVDDPSKISTYSRNKKRIIGYPLLTIVMKSISTRQLYFFVWIKVQRLLREDLRDKRLYDLTYDHPFQLWKIIEELAKEVSFDPLSLPFTLHSCTLSIFYCIFCKSNCAGCVIEPSDKSVSWQPNMAIAVEWKEDQMDQLRDGAFKYDLDDSVKQAQEANDKSISLFDCLNLFSKEEILSEDDKWYCSQCKDFVRASKKMDLWTSPEILIIHLKRFQSSNVGGREKIDAKLEFPVENLDLSNYVLKKGDKSLIYDLYAVSIHSGGLHSGHYTAIAQQDGQWYNFNDSSVSTTNHIPSRGAYILFYQRRKNDPNSMEIEECDRVKLSQDVEDEMTDVESSLV